LVDHPSVQSFNRHFGGLGAELVRYLHFGSCTGTYNKGSYKYFKVHDLQFKKL
jgi:hypothetical protein